MPTDPSVVVSFPYPKPRAVKARSTIGEVQAMIALAPEMGAQNPAACSSVVRYMLRLLPNPPPLDGLERPVARETAADARQAGEFERARQRNIVSLKKAKAWACVAWLEAHPHKAANQ